MKVRSKGKFADIVEEFAHISNFQVNKKTETEKFAHISNLRVNKLDRNWEQNWTFYAPINKRF